MSEGQIRTLLIEDNPGDARLVREMLVDFGRDSFDVQVVDRLSAGLECLATQRFDAVLLDLFLPDSHGMETFGRVHEHAPNVPIVLLTGLDDRTLAVQAVKNGAQDCLVKGQINGDLLGRSVRYAVERQRADEQLHRAMQTAEDASRIKSQFLANMSHEIRTPMHGIIGLTQLLLDTELDESQREYMTMVADSAGSLLELLNDILDISKIEADKLELDIVCFNLRERLSGIVAGLALQAHQKGVDLACDIAPTVPDTLIADPQRLEQILINLVGNAIKFTKEGSIAIHIDATPKRDARVLLHVAVRDTGIGIAPEQQTVIFEPFAQADGSTTRRFGGSGLGLAISKELATLAGGRLWVESEVGVGSTFRFTVPCGLLTSVATGSGTPAPEQRADDPVPAGAAAPVQGPLRILLAEDNLVNQRLGTAILERRGHTVVVVANGKEAVHAYETLPFDVILMDAQMPEMDGFEATAAIREREQHGTSHVPIVALTAHAMKGDRQRCLDAGMDAYVSKPLDVGKLMDVIAAVTAPELPVVDREAAWATVGGDAGLLAEITGLLFDNLPEYMAHIHEAVEEEDAVALERAAHALKGCIANLGAKRAAAVAAELEHIGASCEVHDAGGALARLDREIAELSRELDRFREEATGARTHR